MAFYEVIEHLDDCDAYLFFYDGDITGATEYLESIGFKNIKILDNKPYSMMEGYMLLPSEY
ncbi:hypothetical protein Cylst_6639 (plasmid) [Cylindrospermum stagnale PCC 7417]|uniref:Uncharacterized protein n=1 Tax=Cylindrospermum stagnale PCC 7417 TaxID=56107 RepID=K9X8K6_9NOST|nr:hypothetical protein Cylst_6639 [Cylindrospermum stagnale PCC 7417]